MIAASPRRTAVFLSLSAGALAAACSVQPGPGESDTEKSETREQGVSHGPSEPRMRSDVYHPSVHVFTTGWPAGDVTRAARKVKELVLGSAAAPTCHAGPAGKAQLAVQTEYIAPELARASSPQAAFAELDARLDALFAEGLAVHLLLPVHQVGDLPSGWQGVDWSREMSTWPNASAFVPMKPCLAESAGGARCPYDVLFEDFQRPVIQHLVATGRARKLAVIYVMNEFGYKDTLSDSRSIWGGGADWKRRRAEALAYTARRALDKARSAAAGEVPVGLKLASVIDPDTGWAKDPVHGTDQLSPLLNDVMEPGGDVLGYDVYFEGSGFDPANRARLAPFLPAFAGGRFEIAEFGRACTGSPDRFVRGSRTRSTDVTDAAAAWPHETGLSLFALNAGGQGAGCYALTDPGNIDVVYPDARAEARGLWDLIKTVTGASSPGPC